MPRLYPAALRLTRHHHDAEDLLQDTFAKAYLKFHQFAPGSSLRAWLHRILITTFYSSCRKRGRQPAEVPATILGEAADCPCGLPPAWTGPLPRSAEAEAIDNLASTTVMAALADLPECFKAAVYLADVHGYQCGEIAVMTGVPLGTVMSRLHRGRQMLRMKVRGAAERSPVRRGQSDAGRGAVTRTRTSASSPSQSPRPNPNPSPSLATAA
jgi:RNA polymerase sigma-70 factor (ECF subfamily)